MRNPRTWCQASRGRSWTVFTSLLLLLLLLAALDYRIGQLPRNEGPPLCVLPMAIGFLILSPLQEFALAAAWMGIWTIAICSFHQTWTTEMVQAVASPIPILASWIWIAGLVQKSDVQQAQLTQQKQQLMDKLVLSLQTSCLAHELRQPLSQLLLRTRLLQYQLEQEDSISPKLCEPLQQLMLSGTKIEELITTITGLLNTTNTVTQPVNLANLSASCLDQRRPALEADGIQTTRSGLHLAAVVMGDARQLECLMINLVDNAHQSLRRLPSHRRQLNVAIHCCSNQVHLVVADNGSGLPSLKQEDVILSSTKPNGMGIGLMIAQTIARRHGGALRLGRSAELGGAELRLSLPVALLNPRPWNGKETPAGPIRHR